jgi:GNAT superfamily N-acetyltransferase
VPPVPDDRQRSLHAELVQALDGDAFARFEVDPGGLSRIRTVAGRAAAFVSVHPHRAVTWVSALAADPGSPADVDLAVRLLVDLAAEAAEAGNPVTGVTVSRGGRDLLPAALRPPEAWQWDFWWTDVPPAPVRTEYGDTLRVVDLDSADPRIPLLLEVASPSAPISPGDPRVTRWAAIEDPDGGLTDTGGLAALLAETQQRSGAAHLNDVATHPDRWRRALAKVLCGQVTADALAAGRPAVTLGMYADNDAARRVYDALGFRCVRGQTSGPLTQDPPA